MPEPTGQSERTKLFRYLTNELSGEYRQIMSLFAGPLLGDLSAAEVSLSSPGPACTSPPRRPSSAANSSSKAETWSAASETPASRR